MRRNHLLLVRPSHLCSRNCEIGNGNIFAAEDATATPEYVHLLRLHDGLKKDNERFSAVNAQLVNDNKECKRRIGDLNVTLASQRSESVDQLVERSDLRDTIGNLGEQLSQRKATVSQLTQSRESVLQRNVELEGTVRRLEDELAGANFVMAQARSDLREARMYAVNLFKPLTNIAVAADDALALMQDEDDSDEHSFIDLTQSSDDAMNVSFIQGDIQGDVPEK
uniref:Uncharacterized protein n=1 Tax=Mycena chlorophos TaxID=658473 RepID=A0ABQ0L2C4_MYCCL|nr:predicted protein [Mycena chlorophos]